jgi:hypothetical protein
MPLPVIGHFDAGEADSRRDDAEVVSLALVPIGRGVDAEQRRNVRIGVGCRDLNRMRRLWVIDISG